MKTLLVIDGKNIEVTRKNIKNIYLRIRAPEWSIAVSVPEHICDETIRILILSRLDWIKKRREKIKYSAQFKSKKYIDSEYHYIWGSKYLLTIVEKNAPPTIVLTDDIIQLTIKPGTPLEKKKRIFNNWSREQLQLKAEPLVEKWCLILCVSINKLYIQKMKSCWGSCNTLRETIRLNTELVKKPIECLEYVVLHELVHLIEPSHNKNFHDLMTKHLSDWKERKQLLNKLH